MPSLNWFTLNRNDGGPAYSWKTNRTSAPLYWNDWFYGVVITAAAFITLLVILSPTYKHQWKTLSMVTTSVLLGGAFVLGLAMPEWQTTGPTPIRGSITIRDPLDMDLVLDVHIGLTHVNITLFEVQDTTKAASEPKKGVVLPRLLPRDSSTDVLLGSTQDKTHDDDDDDDDDEEYGDIRFNERVELMTADGMRHQIREALRRGLPLPILTVLNYLAHQEEGFRWSVDFRQAGFYCKFVLSLTLVAWAWANIFFLVIPRYGAAALMTAGLLALLSVLIYWILLPSHDLVIHLNGSVLRFKLGGCYWTVLTAGLAALMVGTILLIVDIRHPGTITFDLELETDIKLAVVNKSIERKSIKLQPSLHAAKKASLKPRISVIDGTAGAYADKTVSQGICDSGISTAESCTTSGLLSQRQLDSSSDLDQIATLDGSYLRSTVTNLIQAELVVPKIYSYTFRHGRELPSFHESTISLNSEAVPRYLDSIAEEAQIHQTPSEDDDPSAYPASDESEREEDWQDPVPVNEDNIEPDVSLSDDVFEAESDSFCSTMTVAAASTSKVQSPRRRTQRAPSLGSHRDIVNTL